MFSYIFIFWLNFIDKPSIQNKINLFSYINVRFFRMNFISSYITFFIFINSLNLKTINTFFSNNSFFFFFFKYLYCLLFFLFLFVFFSL